jgi:hypothetical protein
MEVNKNSVKVFPLKLDEEFSKMIDIAVFMVNQTSGKKISKHQYCLDAIYERVRRDLGDGDQ